MKVPIYKSESTLSKSSGGINMSVRANPGALSAGSQAMASFGDQAMKTSLQFYEMERKNDYEAQKQNGIVSYTKKLNEIKEKAFLQPSNVADTYFDDEAKKARTEISNTFTNEVAKKDYLNESEIDFINKRVSVRANSSNRRINDQAGTHLSRVAQLQYDSINGNKAEKHAALNELFGDKPNKIDGIFDKLKKLGYYSSPQSLNATNKMMASITEGNVVNTFDSLGTLIEKQNFIKSFKNKPPVSLGNIKTRQLVRGFEREVGGLQREQKLLIREFKVDIKELNSIIKKGGLVSDTIINGMTDKAQTLGDKKSLELVERLNLQKTVMNGLNKSSPKEVANYISTWKEKGFINVEGIGLDTEFEVDLLKDAEIFLKNMRSELNKDPISFAATTNLIENFTPLNFESPDQLGDTLLLRKQQAVKVSARYEVPIKYFTQDELSAVSAKLQESSSDQKMAFFASIQSVFGSKTKDVLVELNQKGPEFAHIGGLLVTKNIDSATLAMQGSDLIKNNVQPIEYTTTNTKIPYIDIVSASLSELSPTVIGSAEKVAKNIYTKLAYDSRSTNFDSVLFEEAVQRSLGGVYDRDGELAAGGIQAVNEHQTLLPSSISPEMFEEMIEVLEPFNFKTNNIDPSLLNDIKDGDFVFYAIANGAYKLAREKRVGGSTRAYASDLDGNELILNVLDFFEQEQS